MRTDTFMLHLLSAEKKGSSAPPTQLPWQQSSLDVPPWPLLSGSTGLIEFITTKKALTAALRNCSPCVLPPCCLHTAHQWQTCNSHSNLVFLPLWEGMRVKAFQTETTLPNSGNLKFPNPPLQAEGGNGSNALTARILKQQ